MTTKLTSLRDLSLAVSAAPRAKKRRLVALAGSPASGKSTLADQLASSLNQTGCKTQVVPMDGFHLDNQILRTRGYLTRKGAPESFDVKGLVTLIDRLGQEEEVFYPIFDRGRDIAIAAAGVVDESCETIVVEGNYLLFDAPVWRNLARYWDLSVYLDVAEGVLMERLVSRWVDHGLSQDAAEKRARENDVINARSVTAKRLAADVVFAP